LEAITRIVRDPASTAVLPRPLPLRQMVDILVEVWEEEGLFE